MRVWDSIRKNMVVSLLLTLIVVVSLVSLVSTVYFQKTNTRYLRQTLDDTIHNALQFALIGYTTPLWNLDLTSVGRLNEALLNNRMLVAVNVFSDNNFIAGHIRVFDGNSVEYLRLAHQYIPPKEDPFIKQVSGDITYDNQKIGSVQIFYTERYITEAARIGTVRIIVSFILTALSIIIFTFINLNRAAIRPILDLARMLQEIASSSDYSRRVTKRSANEIGMLYDGFNSMLDQIEKRESDRQQAQRELQKAMNLLDNVLDSMPSVLIATDMNQRITHWNKTATQHTGISETVAIGSDLGVVFPSLNRYRDDFSLVVESQQPRDYYRESIDGEGKFYHVSLYPIMAGAPAGVVIRMDDVTELENKERELRHVQKMEIIGMMAGGIAHDFNNLLVGIIGAISIFQHKLQKGSDINKPDLVKFIDVMQNAGLRASDMVQQLLNLSRKQDVTLQPVDIRDSVNTVLKICRNTFDKNIQLVSHLPLEEALTSADPAQIEQVLLNLCVNANHAMTIMLDGDEHRGGRIIIDVDEAILDKHFSDTHPSLGGRVYWKIAVRDTGIGMDKETLSHVFDPFFTTKPKGKGTGLGLTMAYNIVQQHNGFIEVYSEMGVGTTFNIYLPKLTETAEREEKPSAGLILHGEGLILVVDDEEVVRQTAKVILEECGYQVIIAEDGVQGVEIFRKRHREIAAVVLDMVMPRMIGKDAFVEMKSIQKDVKVLLSSGFKQDERVESVISLGVRHFIQKPYTIQNLSRAIHQVVYG